MYGCFKIKEWILCVAARWLWGLVSVWMFDGDTVNRSGLPADWHQTLAYVSYSTIITMLYAYVLTVYIMATQPFVLGHTAQWHSSCMCVCAYVLQHRECKRTAPRRGWRTISPKGKMTSLIDFRYQHTLCVCVKLVGGRNFCNFFVFCGRLNIYYINTLYITYTLCVYIQLYTYSAGCPQWKRDARNHYVLIHGWIVKVSILSDHTNTQWYSRHSSTHNRIQQSQY